MYIIDAKSKSLGRIASEAAFVLMGKNNPAYAKNKLQPGIVHITNASKLISTGQKLTKKVYTRYTGFPGGKIELSQAQIIEKKGHGDVLMKAIRGMLPANKLRAKMLKNVRITD
ncbi:MAG: 50S ribosomal protein L13 [Candidatus Vogelbacteria bacterium]|nr:50S ribosomal protein L13 [Candidatus Vogelbacteria bacterium]